MIHFNDKYKKPITSIILLGYFFLFSYNIIHYHQYNVSLYSHNININGEDSSSGDNHFVKMDFHCPVHSTYTSLHNITVQSSGSNSNTLYEFELLSYTIQNINFQKVLNSANSLRAPPSLFS